MTAQESSSPLWSPCRWPPLAPPYAGALRQAVALVLSRFDPVGIIACGSILRGQGGPTSDLDIYVIHEQPVRQRLQRRFDGVPAEIFVNPPAAIRRYFAEEYAALRPLTAHMLSHGFVVLDRGPLVRILVDEARVWLAKPPFVGAETLTMQRYLIVDQLDNARDLLGQEAENADLILHEAVRQIIQHSFAAAQRTQPRTKELLGALAALDPAAGDLARTFYRAATVAERLAAAERLAQHVLGVTNFFEWESTPEPIEA